MELQNQNMVDISRKISTEEQLLTDRKVKREVLNAGGCREGRQKPYFHAQDEIKYR